MFHVVIPARMGSTRFPGKVLHPIDGRPMIEYVYRNALASGATSVIIATDSEEVIKACRGFGGRALMTGDHPSGSDRVAETARLMQWEESDIVVNVQGDEPLMPARAIRKAADVLARTSAAVMSTLAIPIEHADDFFSPHVVKVVADDSGKALYFSRAPIPWARDDLARSRDELPEGLGALRHIGIYAYRNGFLQHLTARPPAELERWEALEQLRALGLGAHIQLDVFNGFIGPGVDVPEDVAKVEAAMTATRSQTRVLFVCMGNICRSPTAQGVAEKIAEQRRMENDLMLDSAGTHAYHVGEPPDHRAIKAASRRGIDISPQRARRLTSEDFNQFDYILVMDQRNFDEANAMAPANTRAKLVKMMEFASVDIAPDVPDPYYGGGHGFEQVLDLLENAMGGFFDHLQKDAK